LVEAAGGDEGAVFAARLPLLLILARDPVPL
jgi:hypothetical protein